MNMRCNCVWRRPLTTVSLFEAGEKGLFNNTHSLAHKNTNVQVTFPPQVITDEKDGAYGKQLVRRGRKSRNWFDKNSFDNESRDTVFSHEELLVSH